ncbi:hypothetical protein IT084_06355 [Desulfallas sp. Bu1-1]|uniref:hypothetical protein n=1 Tax=Desulfallas sp. Bu1-1 TaxID=2787620 RepID=UPI0018A0C226|nr:hypothetical protein [Desulfallas sp. Bu1-1]MBF7082600.1 hypothetical protein [Desulfallas sp. Bu1-1]
MAGDPVLQMREQVTYEQEEYIELQPAEKKLVGWSIGIGIVALAFLIWISYSFKIEVKL